MTASSAAASTVSRLARRVTREQGRHVYFWFYEEDARDLIDALDTHLTQANWVLARTDTRDGQRELHRRLDRLEDIRNRLRTQLTASTEPRQPSNR